MQPTKPEKTFKQHMTDLSSEGEEDAKRIMECIVLLFAKNINKQKMKAKA